MSVAIEDHQQILRQTLKICEAQLYQRFHADLLATRMRVMRESAEELERARSAAQRSISDLFIPPSPDVESANSELEAILHEHRQLEDAGHAALVTFMREKAKLTDEYEELFNQHITRTQRESQAQLKQLVQASNLTDADAPHSTDTAQAPEAGTLKLSSYRPSSALTPGDGILQRHQHHSTASIRIRDEDDGSDASSPSCSQASSRPASGLRPASGGRSGPITGAAPAAAANVTESPSQLTPGRIRPRTAKPSKQVTASNPTAKPSKLSINLALANSPTRVKHVTSTPSDPTPAAAAAGGAHTGRDAARLNFDSGIDGLIASLNATLSSVDTRYRILPDRVHGSLRDCGRTLYSRRVARAGGRAMSRVSRDLLARSAALEREYAKKREREEEAHLQEAIIMAPKGSPIYKALHAKMKSPTAHSPTNKAFSFPLGAGHSPTSSGGTTTAKVRDAYAAEWAAQRAAGLADRSSLPTLNEDGIRVEKKISIMRPSQIDYEFIGTTESRLEQRITDDHTAEQARQRAIDGEWQREKRKRGSSVDSIGLYLNSTSTLEGVAAMRADAIERPRQAMHRRTQSMHPTPTRAPTAGVSGVGADPPRSRSRSRSREHQRAASLTLTPAVVPVTLESRSPQPRRSTYNATIRLASDMPKTNSPVRPKTAGPLTNRTQQQQHHPHHSHPHAEQRSTTKSPVPMLTLDKHLPTGPSSHALDGLSSSRSDWAGSDGSLDSDPDESDLSLYSTSRLDLSSCHDVDSSLASARDTPVWSGLSTARSSATLTPLAASRSQPNLSARGMARLKRRVHNLSLQMEEPLDAALAEEIMEAERVKKKQEEQQREEEKETSEGEGDNKEATSMSPADSPAFNHSRPTSALESPSAPDFDRSSSFKSRPSTGLRLSFSIPTAVDGEGDVDDAQSTPPAAANQNTKAIHGQPREDEDDSSGMSSDTNSDNDADEKHHADDGNSASYPHLLRPSSTPVRPSTGLSSSSSLTHFLDTPTPLSPPLSPAVPGVGDPFSRMFDATPNARSRPNIGTETPSRQTSRTSFDTDDTNETDNTNTTGTGENTDADRNQLGATTDGPSTIDYTLSSMRSDLNHLRHSVSLLRSQRSTLQRELDVVSAQRAHVQDLAAIDHGHATARLLGKDGSVGQEYTDADHQLNLLHLRQILYAAAKEQRDLEFLQSSLQEELSTLSHHVSLDRAPLVDLISLTRHQRLVHSRILRREQHRVVGMLGATELIEPTKVLDGIRTLTRFWSQLHGYEREMGGVTPLAPTCQQCGKNLRPAKEDEQLRQRMNKERRIRIQAEAKRLAQEACTNTIATMNVNAGVPSTLALRPSTAVPVSRPHAIDRSVFSSTTSLTSLTSSQAAVKRNLKQAQKTEWDMLEELAGIAAEMNANNGSRTATKRQTKRATETMLGLPSTKQERTRVVKDRPEGRFTGGELLRPTNAVETQHQTDQQKQMRSNTGSNIMPRVAMPNDRPNTRAGPPTVRCGSFQPHLGPDGLSMAHRIKSQLLARAHAAECDLFVQLSNGATVCRDCRFHLEASSSSSSSSSTFLTSTFDRPRIELFAPDEATTRFFAHRAQVTLEQSRTDISVEKTSRQSNGSHQRASMTVGHHPSSGSSSARPFSAVTGREIGGPNASRPISAINDTGVMRSAASTAALTPTRNASLAGSRPLSSVARVGRVVDGPDRDSQSTLTLLQRLRGILGFHSNRAAQSKRASGNLGTMGYGSTQVQPPMLRTGEIAFDANGRHK